MHGCDIRGLKSEEKLKIKQLLTQLETDPRILPFKDPVDFEGKLA